MTKKLLLGLLDPEGEGDTFLRNVKVINPATQG